MPSLDSKEDSRINPFLRVGAVDEYGTKMEHFILDHK